MVLVVQSHRAPLPGPWYAACIESVRGFVDTHGYHYRWLGDELFDLVPTPLLEKTRTQPVVATDLARLIVLEACLKEGADRVIWVDADVLILDPGRLRLGSAGAQFGREIWVEATPGGGFTVRRQIHNAFMAFDRGDPVLPFYRFAAMRILERYRSERGGMTPQLIGPKLLTMLNNAIGLDVVECAGVLSPPVIEDVLRGGGPALDRLRETSAEPLLAVNVCGSSVRRGLIDDAQMSRVIAELCRDPALLHVDR